LHPRVGAEDAASLLRSGHPAVIGRIKDERLLLDMLTVSDAELPELAAALNKVLGPVLT
jgi:L-seryl-tRNA(Ser) seleniumtransferase